MASIAHLRGQRREKLVRGKQGPTRSCRALEDKNKDPHYGLGALGSYEEF